MTLAAVFLLALGVLLGRVTAPDGAGVRQRTNLAVATEELPRVQTILDGDTRFKDVIAFVYTGQDGSIGLTGTVEADADLFRLMLAVAEARLRIAVSWQVKVRERHRE